MGSWLKSLSVRALLRLVVASLATFLLGRSAEANPAGGGELFVLGLVFLLALPMGIAVIWSSVVSLILTWEGPTPPTPPQVMRRARTLMAVALVLAVVLGGWLFVGDPSDRTGIGVLLAGQLSAILIAGSHLVGRTRGRSWRGLRAAFWLPPLMLLLAEYYRAGPTVSPGQGAQPTRVSELVTPRGKRDTAALASSGMVGRPRRYANARPTHRPSSAWAA